MSCCGGRRYSTPGAPAAAPGGPVQFEFRGTGSLTLYGRVTGRRYHFPGPGSRVLADPRDARSLQVIAEIEAIRHA
ncbi:MAG: hypothetical protein R3E10_14785 [Gemmatimonadota bacterium]